jgi:tRNA dimethylallyltransferase
MNSDISPLPSVALIAGPTASGKSALALALARSLREAGREAVIVNADASSVYRDIPILSAAPTAKERREILHRLVGHIDGAEACDAARWAAEAKAAIAEAHAAGAIPILAGGTGLYIDTLLRGIAPVPEIPADLRAAIRALPVGDAYRRLQTIDPGAANRLKPLDKARIARALEVIESTGTPLSEWQKRRIGGIGERIALTPLILLPPRAWIYERCDARLVQMFASGAIDEVQALLERRLDPALPVMNAIGVPQIVAWLNGEFAPDDGAAWALAMTQRTTRQYAKRQYTFFRGQFPADWPRIDTEINDDNISEIVTKLRQSLLTR